MAIIGLVIFGQSAVQAHNPDGSLPSVMHFITAPHHLVFIVLFSVLLCIATLRLKKNIKTYPVKK
jgi:hypothetical protein